VWLQVCYFEGKFHSHIVLVFFSYSLKCVGKMEFQVHPSNTMVELFRNRPFQGQTPERASIIFLSSDANYSPDISDHYFFEHVLKYQEDGVTFWKNYKRHHPFLLPCYPFKRTIGLPIFRARKNKRSN